MSLTIRQVRYVCEVAHQGSINAASKALRISQSSVIAAIGIAEREMGARLFDRHPARGVVVTPVGERFLASARSLLAAEAEFGRTIGGLAKGHPSVIRIGCFEPFSPLFMPELLRRYSEAVGPMEIQFFEGDQVQLLEWCKAGYVDLVVTYDLSPDFPEGTTPICKIPAHALLSANDPLARRRAVSLADLAKRPLVLLDVPLSSTYTMALFDVLATRPKIGFHTRSYETVRAAVACGFGVAVLNTRPIGKGSPDSDAVVRRPLIDDLPAPSLVVADMYGPSKPRFIAQFLETIRSFFHEIGPRGFAVSIPVREAGLLLV